MTKQLAKRFGLAVFVLCGFFSGSAALEPPASKTVGNLRSAFNAESNARVRAEAFSVKADGEGFHQVASLFRAAAKAEEIHAGIFAGLIRQMGEEPKAFLETPVVLSTKENVESTINTESYDAGVVYLGYIKQAEREGNPDAVRSFRWAEETEKGRVRLFKGALTHLSSRMKGTRDTLVCSVCGLTTEDFSTRRCPLCHVPRGKFILVK
jgi:rubrerythrin